MLPSIACIKPQFWLRRCQFGHAAVLVDDHGDTAFTTVGHDAPRLIAQSLTRSLAVLKGEVPRQPSVQLSHRGVPVRVHVLVLDVAPQAFGENVVQRTLRPYMLKSTPSRFKTPMNATLVNCLTWSVLKISGLP